MESAIKKNGVYESVPFYANVIQTQGKCGITLQTKLFDNEYATHQTLPKCNTVTTLTVPLPALMRLTSKMPFDYTVPGLVPHYYDKTQIGELLYEIQYGNIDYAYAKEYFEAKKVSLTPNPSKGGCSAIRNGCFVGRTFDWCYDNQVQFVVHTPATLTRHAVVGVSGIIPGIDKTTVAQDDIVKDGYHMFTLVPFYLLDGMNDKGVFCTHNVVPLDDADDPTTEVRARIEERDRICAMMLPRFVLDNFATAAQALAYLRDYTTIFFHQDMIVGQEYQSHFMLGDSRHTYIIEFIDGEMVVKEAKYMTNFNISQAEFSKDGTILRPATEHGIAPYGFGLERWNIIAANYRYACTLDGMRSLLEKVNYAHCYDEDDFWYSEAVKFDDDMGNPITVDTDPSLCQQIKATMQDDYINRDRDNPNTWISTHTSLYDISHKTLYLRNQEDEGELVFVVE